MRNRFSARYAAAGVLLIVLGGLGGGLVLTGGDTLVPRRQVTAANSGIERGDSFSDENIITVSVAEDYLLPTVANIGALEGLVALNRIEAGSLITLAMVGEPEDSEALAGEATVVLRLELPDRVLAGDQIVLVESPPALFRNRYEQCEAFLNGPVVGATGQGVDSGEGSARACAALSGLWTFPTVVGRGDVAVVEGCSADSGEARSAAAAREIAANSQQYAEIAVEEAAKGVGRLGTLNDDEIEVGLVRAEVSLERARGGADSARSDLAEANSLACDVDVEVVWPPGQGTMHVRVLQRDGGKVEVAVAETLALALASAEAEGRIAYHYVPSGGRQ